MSIGSIVLYGVLIALALFIYNEVHQKDEIIKCYDFTNRFIECINGYYDTICSETGTPIAIYTYDDNAAITCLDTGITSIIRSNEKIRELNNSVVKTITCYGDENICEAR